MRTLAVVVTCLIFVALPLGALDTYPRQPGVHVEHYVFALELSDASDEIRGEATVTIRFTKDGLTSFFLDLATPSNGKGMTATGVSSDSVPLRYTHAANRLTISLPRPTRASELRRFTVRYHGIPADGLRTGVNKYNERCFFSWNWPDKAREWLPMIDHPSAKATSEFIVTAPDKYMVVANGLLQSEVSLGDGRKRTHWKQGVPIASWLNAIGVEQFAVHHAGFVKGVELQTWVAHQELDAGIARFETISRNALEFFSDRIGPYSYEKLANVTAPFDRGATEHASVIFYGDGGTRSGAAPAPPATPQAAPAGRGGARGAPVKASRRFQGAEERSRTKSRISGSETPSPRATGTTPGSARASRPISPRFTMSTTSAAMRSSEAYKACSRVHARQRKPRNRWSTKTSPICAA